MLPLRVRKYVLCLKQYLVAYVHRSCVLLLACVPIVRGFHYVVLKTYLFVILLQQRNNRRGRGTPEVCLVSCVLSNFSLPACIVRAFYSLLACV